MQSLGRLDEAQKKMEFLSNNVQNLNNVLTDKKTRGIFGEVQLYQVLSSAFGNNSEIYQKQYKLSNGTMADAVIFAPEPVGTICIDSKFPLENYRRIFEDISENRLENEKNFEQNLKKHIVRKDCHGIKKINWQGMLQRVRESEKKVSEKEGENKRQKKI